MWPCLACPFSSWCSSHEAWVPGDLSLWSPVYEDKNETPKRQRVSTALSIMSLESIDAWGSKNTVRTSTLPFGSFPIGSYDLPRLISSLCFKQKRLLEGRTWMSKSGISVRKGCLKIASLHFPLGQEGPEEREH